MKRLIPILVVALAATLFWFRGLILPEVPGTNGYLGYIEGETVMIGAPQAGRIVARPVKRGDAITKDALLFALDDAALKLEVERAEAAIVTADASYRNLLTGKRAPELVQIEAQQHEVSAALDLARKELDRAKALTHSGTAAQARLDTALADVAALEARLAQLAAAAETARLPGRNEEIAAALSRVQEAKALAELARQKLKDLTLTSPIAARVEETFFGVGEWVTAGQPVVSLLAAENVTLRFFVPASTVALAQPGKAITFACDSCGEARTATITRVAPSPEYTPPVIYSQEARAKLVFLVEAAPSSTGGLLPGLPIEVAPLE